MAWIGKLPDADGIAKTRQNDQYNCGIHFIHLFFSDELGYLVDAIVNEDKIDSFDSRPNNMSIEDKHLLSRLLLLLNPNYSNLAGGGVGGGGRNRRPSRRKKPIINVIEGILQSVLYHS